MKRKRYDPSAFLGTESVTRKYQRKYVDLFHPGQRVLDIGCGAGVFLEMLRGSGVHAVGVDSSPLKIADCRKKDLEAYRSDALRFLKRKGRTFHGIFCSHFVEHLPPLEVLAFFSQAHRRLELGGLLIIITPNFKNIDVMSETFWLDVSHLRPYPIPLLEKMLHSTGFEIVTSGIDAATNRRLPKRNPWLGFKYVLKKIRFGEYFGKGDSFVVARKV